MIMSCPGSNNSVMTDFYYELSWKAVFRAYTLKQFCKDSTVPFILTLAFVLLACFQIALPLVSIILRVCDIMVNLLPSFISILITSFAIWISFFLSNSMDYIKKDKEGYYLLNELNASFLMEISFSIVGMLFTLSVSLISSMKFVIDNTIAEIINISVLFALLFICFAVIWWLIYIAKNLHNIAKFTILFEKEEKL